MNPLLSTHTWVSLSQQQRSLFHALFNIPRSGNTEVNDGQIISDGTTPQDLANLTIEKMQTYVGDTSTDFHKLFDKTLAKVQDTIEGKPAIQPVVVQEINNAIKTPHVKKSPKKNK